MFPAAADRYPPVGENKSEHGDGMKAFQRGDIAGPCKLCPFDRVEEIERHRVNCQLPQSQGEFNTLPGGFPQAEDAPAADLHAGLFGDPHRFYVLFVIVGGADAGEKAARCLKIVVIRLHTGFLEDRCRCVIDDAEGAGGEDLSFAPYSLDSAADPGKLISFSDAGAAGNNTVAAGAVLFSFLGAGDDLLLIHQGVNGCIGLVMGRLGAETTVFRTASRLCVDDRAKKDIISHKPFLYPACGTEQGVKICTAHVAERKRIGFRYQFAGEYPICQDGDSLVHDFPPLIQISYNR